MDKESKICDLPVDDIQKWVISQYGGGNLESSLNIVSSLELEFGDCSQERLSQMLNVELDEDSKNVLDDNSFRKIDWDKIFLMQVTGGKVVKYLIGSENLSDVGYFAGGKNKETYFVPSNSPKLGVYITELKNKNQIVDVWSFFND